MIGHILLYLNSNHLYLTGIGISTLVVEYQGVIGLLRSIQVQADVGASTLWSVMSQEGCWPRWKAVVVAAISGC